MLFRSGANHECVIRNCTVAGNTGTLYAGGIRFEHMAGLAPGRVTIINTIAVGNRMGSNESNYSVTDVLKNAVDSRNCFFGLASEAGQTSDSLRGDLNDDETVNLKDAVLLRRYIAGGWNVEPDESASDINGDGTVNLKDVVMLRRFIAGGWDVTL